jgi:hypothetical protein
MKTRSGFVSNSSSSSFIIGYGIIKDRAKLDAYIKSHNLERCLGDEIKITDPTIPESIEQVSWENKIEIVGGNSISILVPSELVWTKDLLIIDIGNNEGDGGVFYGNDDGESNYDAANDIDFFPVYQQECYELLHNNEIIDMGESRFGAERNG